MENFREEEAKEEEQLPEFYPSDSIKENSYHMIYGKPPSDHYRFAKTSANIKWPSDLWKSGKLIYDIVHQEKCAPPPETPEDTILRFDSKFESGNLSKVYHIKGKYLPLYSRV